MAISFSVTPSSSPSEGEAIAEILRDPGFGVHFTDHMARATWSKEQGWHDGRICAVEPYKLHPAASVFHYGQEIFEGLKAYVHEDGQAALFRPDKNAARFATSADRLVLPRIDADSFLRSIESLVRIDQAWIPRGNSESSLYLRPYMFASESYLGVRPSRSAEYGVIATPAGPYFSDGVAGITLWITTKYSRAAPGGTGSAKCGGNYAGSLLAQMEAEEHGCDQVLFTGGRQDAPVLDESGTMNIFVVTNDGRLLTPPLGTILDGVTRDSVLTLAPDHALTPLQETVTRDGLLNGCRDGSVKEVFAAGTAAVITPIVGFRGEGIEAVVGDGQPGPATIAIREHLLGIQFGNLPDRHGWIHLIDLDS